MYVVLLGAPGAGKGTQAKVMSGRMRLPHVASGDLFRENLASNTRLGQLVRPYVESGQLVPDNITTEMVVERLMRPDCARGAILDGYPRTVDQARSLDTALGRQGLRVDKALYIEVAPEELVRRLSARWICRGCQTPYHETENPPKVKGVCDACGGELYQRVDDAPETVKRRLNVYFDQTAPLIEYYRDANVLVAVDGQQGIEEVTRDVLAALGIA
ncbi:MAG: adenylate kinase [Chloroflexota bacterium]